MPREPKAVDRVDRRRKLSDQERDELINDLRRKQYTQRQLAQLYGVSQPLVAHYAKRLTHDQPRDQHPRAPR